MATRVARAVQDRAQWMWALTADVGDTGALEVRLGSGRCAASVCFQLEEILLRMVSCFCALKPTWEVSSLLT